MMYYAVISALFVSWKLLNSLRIQDLVLRQFCAVDGNRLKENTKRVEIGIPFSTGGVLGVGQRIYGRSRETHS